MEQSTNFNFNLPSKSDETPADIDLISDNFRTVDDVVKQVDDVVKQVDDVVKQVQDDVSKMPTNLVNGSAYGSVRGIDAKEEEDGYIMGACAVALGYGTAASGDDSHAEGLRTTASGSMSHAEGWVTTASGECSHAEGDATTASGGNSHAEGGGAIASGIGSHAEGHGTIAGSYCQHAQGKYNIADTNNRYAHIVGNGENERNRSNAHTLDWDGNAWFAGDVYVGGTSQDDANATKLSSVATDITQVKEKLDGIEEGANKTIVDTAFSDTSTNPIQNKVVNERMNKKVWRTNGTATGAVDWNTLTTTGCYKIQNCTMTTEYNAPQDEYGFGVLQVLNSEWETGTSADEHRVVQIYMPHKYIRKYNMYIRTNNSSTGYDNWTDWEGFYGGSKLSAALNSKADTETGTCTLSASNGTVSNATYSVVGDFVTLNFKITPAGAGNIVVSGLPFAATKNQSGFVSSTATYNITANQTSITINSTSGAAEYCTVTYLK